MILYPEVSTGMQLLAAAAGFGVATPVGVTIYRLLAPVRGWGPVGRFVALAWAWFLALLTGLGAMVFVAGPYVFAGRTREGGYLTEPITRGEAVIICAVTAIFFAVFFVMWEQNQRRQ